MNAQQKNRNIEEMVVMMRDAADDNERAEMLRTLVRSCDFAEVAMQRAAMLLTTERQHLFRTRKAMGWTGVVFSALHSVQAYMASEPISGAIIGFAALIWAAIAYFHFRR